MSASNLMDAPPSNSSLSPSVASREVICAEVIDDVQAIHLFIDGYTRRSNHTIRSYEKECYRFLLWLRSRCSPSPRSSLLPDVGIGDVNSYIDFLASPRAFHPDFLQENGFSHQPFKKSLVQASVALCITVLHRFFDAMREMREPAGQPYCTYNPVKLIHEGINRSCAAEDVEQALTDSEWLAVLKAIENLPQGSEREKKHYHRARWIMQLLYRSLLRREEAAKLTMGSFEATPQGWNIRFVGKSAKKAKIIATDTLMDELKLYRTSLGLPALPSPGESRPAILAVTGTDKGVTGQAIYLICKVIFGMAADLLDERDAAGAQRLRQSSPHWMRHTGISRYMESGVDPRYVQAQARHSSLNITARYDHKNRNSWRDALNAA